MLWRRSGSIRDEIIQAVCSPGLPALYSRSTGGFMRVKLSLFAVLLALACPAFSQTLPSGVQQKASLGGITEYAYPNGLRVLLFPDPSNPKVTVNMTYLVGSRFEGYGETGMAHLLEHVNFIRSTHDRDIKKELTAHGAQWNGSTDY